MPGTDSDLGTTETKAQSFLNVETVEQGGPCWEAPA
jgi:hypothetical protein